MLKGEDKLTAEERKTRQRVCAGKLQTGKAFNHLDALRFIMKQSDPTNRPDPVLRSGSQLGSKARDIPKARLRYLNNDEATAATFWCFGSGCLWRRYRRFVAVNQSRSVLPPPDRNRVAVEDPRNRRSGMPG